MNVFKPKPKYHWWKCLLAVALIATVVMFVVFVRVAFFVE